MKPTLEQIKTDESVWPEGATHNVGGCFTKWINNKEYSLIGGVWKKDSDQWKLKQYPNSIVIPRPTKAFVPEVGVECEGFTTNLAGNWEWCIVEPLKETSDGEYACITNRRILRFIDQFRPIKSERELVVEEALKVLNKKPNCHAK